MWIFYEFHNPWTYILGKECSVYNTEIATIVAKQDWVPNKPEKKHFSSVDRGISKCLVMYKTSQIQ